MRSAEFKTLRTLQTQNSKLELSDLNLDRIRSQSIYVDDNFAAALQTAW